MKPVFLSVDRSLKFWRSDAPYYNGKVQTSPLECVSMDGCARSIRDIEAYSSVLDGSEEPVEVLVPSKAYCSKTSLLATRVIEFPLPPYSFCRASGNVYVCAPTLLFLLAASRYSLHKLIAVGLELCGTYSPRDGMPSKSDHDAICDVQTLRDYVASITGNVRGIQLARRALQYIEDGSASPRETDAYMMYCLPSRLGGFGLDGVGLNSSVDTKKHARAITKLPYIIPDLFWEKSGIALEYESDEWHSIYASGYVPEAMARFVNKTKLMSDSERRRTFEAMEITSITLTNGEFVDFDEAERIARLLTRRMGKRYNSSRRVWVKRTKLHGWLKVPVLERDPGFAL